MLLLLIEINLVYGILFAFFRGWIHAVGEVPFIFGTVVPMTIINVYLFSSDTKREKYEREFASYSETKRVMADILAAMFSLSAILLPFSAELG